MLTAKEYKIKNNNLLCPVCEKMTAKIIFGSRNGHAYQCQNAECHAAWGTDAEGNVVNNKYFQNHKPHYLPGHTLEEALEQVVDHVAVNLTTEIFAKLANIRQHDPRHGALRLGQLIEIIIHPCDLFNLTDNKLLELITEYEKKNVKY